MRDVARAAYNAIEVGATGWMRPDASKGETLEVFQTVALIATDMQNDGLIQILVLHKESMSGHELIDAIQFTKMR